MRDTSLALDLLLRQFLAELQGGPRGYAATMEAWRTHCPGLAVWEEATDRGLVQVLPGSGGMCDMQVTLTAAGAAWLSAA